MRRAVSGARVRASVPAGARTVNRVWLVAVLVPLLLSGAQSARSAMQYEILVRVDRQGDAPRAALERVVVDGDRGRIDIYESDDPGAQIRASLVTHDAGATFALLEDNGRKCGAFSLAEFHRVAGEHLHRGRKLVGAKMSEASVVKTLDEPGPRMLGRSTRHVQIVSKLGATARVLFFKFSYELEIVDDMWLTEEVELPEMEWRYLELSARTGFPYTDAALAQWLEFIDATPLEQISRVRLVDVDSGKTQEKTETYTVRSLEIIDPAKIDPDTFEIGECKQVSRRRMKKEAKQLLDDVIR